MPEGEHHIYFFTFHVVPTDRVDHPDPEVAASAGAFANCYVDFKSQWGSEHLARAAIEDAGWEITDLELTQHLSRSELDADEARAYFDEATSNGWCLVFHTYARDEDE